MKEEGGEGPKTVLHLLSLLPGVQRERSSKAAAVRLTRWSTSQPHKSC